MKRPSLPLRRARSFYAYWQGRRVVFHHFGRRSSISGKVITCELLNFFSDWRTAEEAVAHFRSYTERSIRSTLARLVKFGLLLPKGSVEFRRDNQIAKEWAAWLPEGSFHFSTKDAAYVRSSTSFDELVATLPKTPQPRLSKSIKGQKRRLPPSRPRTDSEFLRVLTSRRTHREFSRKSVSLDAISQLLSLVWGVSGYLESWMFGKLFHKTSPSAGARHPGEVYLMALRVEGLAPGLYHYHPQYHRLETISRGATREKAARYCAHQNYVGDAAALFLMTAVFRRTMWKYHHARAYRVVLLDAGHLCQTFCLVATWLGLAPFCTAALKDTLIERDLKIDGVCESILYVAGVGVPRR